MCHKWHFATNTVHMPYWTKCALWAAWLSSRNPQPTNDSAAIDESLINHVSLCLTVLVQFHTFDCMWFTLHAFFVSVKLLHAWIRTLLCCFFSVLFLLLSSLSVFTMLHEGWREPVEVECLSRYLCQCEPETRGEMENILNKVILKVTVHPKWKCPYYLLTLMSSKKKMLGFVSQLKIIKISNNVLFQHKVSLGWLKLKLDLDI